MSDKITVDVLRRGLKILEEHHVPRPWYIRHPTHGLCKVEHNGDIFAENGDLLTFTEDKCMSTKPKPTHKETMRKLIIIAADRGWTLVDAKPYSDHPDDQHLVRVVIHRTPSDPMMFTRTNFVGYTFNGADGCEGFVSGHYDLTLKGAALWMEEV